MENNFVIVSRETFLIDSHCHLNYLKKDHNLANIIENAYKNNVKIINNICTSIEEIEEIIEICNQYQNVFGSVGIHPSEIRETFSSVEDLIKYTNKNKIYSIGETGLDYHYEPFNKNQQKKNFEIHIEASRKTQLPLIIHSRECDLDMIGILETEIKNGAFPFLLHCFCSSKELAYKALDLGGYISLSGIITFNNSVELQALVKTLPLDKILVETDAPYLAPKPFRGKENFPEYTKHTAEFIAKLLNIDLETFSKITTNNFFTLNPKINKMFHEKQLI